MTAAADPVAEFAAVMRRLRRECDWKAAQTHRSLVRYLLEEAHETVEAIETGDSDHLREELGDLLLQIVFHAVIAEQAGEFTLDDVAREVTAKMRRRNPHVFGDAQAAGPAAVNELWESVKAAEKPREVLTDGIPASLPALLYADKVLDRRARQSGQASAETDPSRTPHKSREAAEREIGEKLMAVVAEARASGIDPEQALRAATRRLVAESKSGD